MATKNYQEEKQRLSFAREEMYTQNVTISIDQEDVQLDFSLEDAIVLQDPSMSTLQQDTLHHNQTILEGGDLSRCVAVDADNSAASVPAQDENQCQLRTLDIKTFQESSPGAPPDNLGARNPPRAKSSTCRLSSRVLLLGRNRVNPCMTDYNKSHLKKRQEHSLLTASITLKEHSWLLHVTRTHFKPLSWPILTIHRRQHRKTGPLKPGPSLNGILQSQSTEAFQGQELDVSRECEDGLVMVDKVQPFLLRFPVGCFGICLGLGSQTMLWKTLSMAQSMQFLHIPKHINLVLWCLAFMTVIMVFTTYTFKCIFHFEAVRREFFDPIRVNFFFAPWIACMMLIIGIPPAVTTTVHPIFWVLFMAPLFALELKIYGQWFSGGKRRLSKVANPATHLSLVGNFVGALLAATVGWTEAGIFFWAVGFAHYLVLLVTLYQRLPTASALPKELNPVFFLFIAAPSTASVAWSHIAGQFSVISKFCYFLALFLYLSLAVRINFFRGFKFSVAWWAYTFPMSSFANATIHYSLEVDRLPTRTLAVMFSSISCVTILSLCLLTVLHICRGTLFPNDDVFQSKTKLSR